MEKAPLLTQKKLYEILTITNTVRREILVERNVPNVIENAATLR